MTKIFLDLDGVILDPSERLYQVYVTLIARLKGQILPKDEYWEMKRKKASIEEILCRSSLDPGLTKSYANQKRELIESIPFLKYDKIIPGTIPSLKHLATKYQLILVTLRGSRPALDWELEYMDIRRYFGGVLSGNNINMRTDSKFKASLIKDKFEVLDPSDIIVGDTETDILAGQELGIRTVAVLTGMRTEEVLQEARPTFILKDLRQVTKALDEGVI